MQFRELDDPSAGCATAAAGLVETIKIAKDGESSAFGRPFLPIA